MGQPLGDRLLVIPIANLFRPKQVVNDIWRASDSDVPQGASWGGRVPAVIHWWWALWLISSFAERILFRRSMEAADTPAEFVSLSQTYIVWDLIDVIPAALAFLVVRKITIRQEEHRRRFERGELPPDAAAPPEPEPDLPTPTDLPRPKTPAERLGRPE